MTYAEYRKRFYTRMRSIFGARANQSHDLNRSFYSRIIVYRKGT
jgi:hypothetical protein